MGSIVGKIAVKRPWSPNQQPASHHCLPSGRRRRNDFRGFAERIASKIPSLEVSDISTNLAIDWRLFQAKQCLDVVFTLENISSIMEEIGGIMATLNVKNLPDSLYKKLQAQAKRERRSVAQQVTWLLSKALMPPRQLSILDLKGLGREHWKAVDAAEYVEKERSSWD